MILYSDFRRHQFDTHLIMMKVTFILRNRVTHGFSWSFFFADDDDDGNQNHNNNIYNTYLRWFPPKKFSPHLPSIFPNPQNKNHTLKGQMGLVHLGHQKHLQVTPVALRRMSDACPPWKRMRKKTPRPQNGSYQYLKGPSSYFCPRGIYTLPDFRKLKGETSTNKQKFKNSGSWSTGFMQNSSPGTPHPTNYLRRFYSVAQKNGQNGWHSWW